MIWLDASNKIQHTDLSEKIPTDSLFYMTYIIIRCIVQDCLIVCIPTKDICFFALVEISNSIHKKSYRNI